jgi:hypothetical protein
LGCGRPQLAGALTGEMGHSVPSGAGKRTLG